MSQDIILSESISEISGKVDLPEISHRASFLIKTCLNDTLIL